VVACTHAEDGKGDRKLAMHHFRIAIKLDPETSFYHVDGGKFAAKHGDLALGLKWLRRAAELAPNDPELIGEVVDCLQELDQLEEAQDIARSALFRNGGDRRFQALWNDMRFEEAHQRQQQSQKRRRVRRAVSEGPVRLQFLKLTVETPTGRKLVRRDGPAEPPAPHFVRVAELRNNKHA
jgi:tetratricopeptide (TPR) repeat protein